MTPERRAYICTKCDPARRVFLLPGENKEPRCPDHGKMHRQQNMPYRKKEQAGGERANA